VVVTMTLAADDERAVIRLLKALLKRLGRAHGVRVTSIAEAPPIDLVASQGPCVTSLETTE
jgi:CheY-like chemotaxis protein